MNNQFEAVMSKKTDAELMQIMNSSPGDYQPLALEAARNEFKKRNLSQEQISSAKDEVRQKNAFIEARANEPLGVMAKIVSFVLPGLRMVFVSGILKADGYERKAKETLRWTFYGVCFYILIITTMFLMTRFS